MYKKAKLKITIAVFLSMFASDAFCQQAFNVSSHSATINGLKFDYSIGEMALITTEKNTNIIVTQGLLQPTGSGSGAATNPGNTNIALSDAVKVYPNPTENILFVESNDNTDAEISYQLFDATGKVVISKNFMQKKGHNKFSLDLQSFAAGSYYLMVRKPNTSGVLENFSYKIQKVH